MNNNTNTAQNQPNIKKRKMKGPTVSLDDIPDIEESK
jgi:hypothetical protein